LLNFSRSMVKLMKKQIKVKCGCCGKKIEKCEYCNEEFEPENEVLCAGSNFHLCSMDCVENKFSIQTGVAEVDVDG